jgi:DNA-binding NarL/FixJ family response regulator
MATDDSTASPTRVFIVDDNEPLRTRVSELLAKTCAVIAAMTDGPEALAMVESLQPEVIVLDVSLSSMTGFEFAQRLREGASTAAIVFLTNYDDPDIVTAAQSLGASGFVVKSRMVSDLTFAVHEARAGRRFVSPAI